MTSESGDRIARSLHRALAHAHRACTRIALSRRQRPRSSAARRSLAAQLEAAAALGRLLVAAALVDSRAFVRVAKGKAWVRPHAAEEKQPSVGMAKEKDLRQQSRRARACAVRY